MNISAIDNENVVIDKFNNDIEYRKYFLNKIYKLNQLFIEPTQAIAEKPKKELNYFLVNSERWNFLKKGTQEKYPSPKTDMCIRYGNNVLCISIKTGKGRITSSDCYETTAILLSVWENKYYNNIEIKLIIDEIILLMKTLGKYKPKNVNFTKRKCMKELNNLDEDICWIRKLEETRNICNFKWCELYNNHKEFVKDVLFECISGKYKFSENCGRAHILIVLKNTNISVLFNLEKRTHELDEYLNKCLPSKNSIFACKSGGTGKEMWLRFL